MHVHIECANIFIKIIIVFVVLWLQHCIEFKQFAPGAFPPSAVDFRARFCKIQFFKKGMHISTKEEMSDS